MLMDMMLMDGKGDNKPACRGDINEEQHVAQQTPYEAAVASPPPSSPRYSIELWVPPQPPLAQGELFLHEVVVPAAVQA